MVHLIIPTIMKIRDWFKNESLLCIKIKDGTSINKSCDDEQNQKHNESNKSKSQKPSWVDSFKARSPSFILIQSSNCFSFLLGSSAIIITPWISKPFKSPYENYRKSQGDHDPYRTKQDSPVQPVTWGCCISSHDWLPRTFCSC